MKSEFNYPLRRYAGILIDLCFDYYLSKNWEAFSSLSLTAFASEILVQLEKNQSLLSCKAYEMSVYLRKYNLLENFINWEQVLMSAYSTGKRLKVEHLFVDIERTLDPLDSKLETTFMAFYPELIERSSNFLLQQAYIRST